MCCQRKPELRREQLFVCPKCHLCAGVQSHPRLLPQVGLHRHEIGPLFHRMGVAHQTHSCLVPLGCCVYGLSPVANGYSKFRLQKVS